MVGYGNVAEHRAPDVAVTIGAAVAAAADRRTRVLEHESTATQVRMSPSR